MPDSKVIVIGGGVIGVCTAYYLARRNHSVTLLEQDEIGKGSSYGNAGQITPGHLALNRPGTMWRNLGMLLRPNSPLFVPFRFDPKLASWFWRFHRACGAKQVRETTRVLAEIGHASFHLFRELAEQIDFGFYEAGNLEVCESDEGLQRVTQEADLLHQLGFESRVLNRKQLLEFEPAISGDVVGAVHHLQSATCNPYTLVTGVAQAAQDCGADIRTHTAVSNIEIRRDQTVVVCTGDDEFQTDNVVIACGAWTPRLAQRLGIKLPIQPGKGYHLDLKPNGAIPETPFVLSERRIFVSRIQQFVRLAGTLEFSGFNLVLRPERINMLIEGSRDHFEGIERLEVLSEWCHLRPMSPDGLPMIGPLPSARHIWVASGHGMLGLTQGPITGKLIADALIDGEPGVDITAVRPQRFQSHRS